MYMFRYLCMSTLFYIAVFRHFYGAMDERSFADCALSTRKFSMVHLGVCIPLASLALYQAPCEWCVDVLFDRQHYLYEMTLMNTSGYFIVDLYLLCRNWFRYGKIDGGALMFVHHLSAFVTYYSVYRAGKGQHVCALFLLNEVSTVFLNGIYFYANKPRLRVACGAGLLVTFFVFRILMFARFNYIMVRDWQTVVALPHYLMVNLVSVALLFSIMNLFWFRQICAGFAKALSKKHRM